MSDRPKLSEHDCGSYLYGSASPHEVLGFNGDGWPWLDATPDYGDSISDAYRQRGHLCEKCSFALLREEGFDGPYAIPITYWKGDRPEVEDVMVKKNEAGTPIYMAEYSRGRAYFEPNEPRTHPCEQCGTETLWDTVIQAIKQ